MAPRATASDAALLEVRRGDAITPRPCLLGVIHRGGGSSHARRDIVGRPLCEIDRVDEAPIRTER